MMDTQEFKRWGHFLVDMIADYYDNIENFPVKSQVKPGDIISKLSVSAPKESDDFKSIIDDFNNFIMPGITHWQSPHFHAYFPANTSFPSILAEFLSSAIGAQCMVWETSPAAAELEEQMTIWMRKFVGLSDNFHGVIQDTASTATLVALLCAREKYSNFSINKSGFSHSKFRIYCSKEAHSSIDKAVKIAGFGIENLVKISTDENFSLIAEELEEHIISDLKNGLIPLVVVAALGTTGSTAIDPINNINEICQKYNIWLHIDAALAGTALILDEYSELRNQVNNADSLVFNPHKWMFTNFDCTLYYVKDKDTLINTFSILPEYLKTSNDDKVNNYRDWGIQLGRRFRALKLWFVLRSFGTDEIKRRIKLHIDFAKDFAEKLCNDTNFELLAPTHFNTVCFRFAPKGFNGNIDALNESILKNINDSGKIYITHTKLNGKYTIRFVVGQTNTEPIHIDYAYELIKEECYRHFR